MTWWQRLWSRRGNGHDAARARDDAAQERAHTEGMAPTVARAAERLGRLPPEEFAQRVASAFNRPRPS